MAAGVDDRRGRERTASLLLSRERGEKKNKTKAESENEDLNFCNVSLCIISVACCFFVF